MSSQNARHTSERYILASSSNRETEMSRGHVLFVSIALIAAIAASICLHVRSLPQDNTANAPRKGTDTPIGESISPQVRPNMPPVRKKAFIQRETPALPPSDAPLANRLDSLETDAKTGDPDTGYALAIELRECLSLDNRYEELQADVKAKRKSAEILADIADVLDKQSEHCKGLSPDDLKNYGQWIELAAHRGSIAAQLGYPAYFGELLPQHALDTEWVENYKKNSLQFLSAAASEGSIDALGQLANTYQDGLLVPKDPIAAYAYEYAMSRTGQAPSATKVLDMWGQELTPQQIEAAKQRGDQIYKSCCM